MTKSCSQRMMILGARRSSERMVGEVTLMVRQRVFTGESYVSGPNAVASRSSRRRSFHCVVLESSVGGRRVGQRDFWVREAMYHSYAVMTYAEGSC